MEVFTRHPWEGNVRELENMIMQGILFSSTEEIRLQNVDLDKKRKTVNAFYESFIDLPYKQAKEKTLVQFNLEYISNLLTEYKGNVSQAARQCGLERQALQQIMRRYGIKAEPFRN